MKDILLGTIVVLIIAFGCVFDVKYYNANIESTKTEYKHYEDQHKKYTDSIADLSKQKIDTADKWRYFIVYYSYLDRVSERQFCGMRWFSVNRFPSLDYLLKGIRKDVKVVRPGKHSICITGIQELNMQDFNDFDDNFDIK
jgi:hypothetical protein